jgi:hypothetical protein
MLRDTQDTFGSLSLSFHLRHRIMLRDYSFHIVWQKGNEIRH